MRTSSLPKLAALLVAALSVLALASCEWSPFGAADSGSLRLMVGGPAAKGLGAKAISSSVATVEVKMTSVPSDLYPPRLASAAYNAAGTTISIANVKVGAWKVELFLNDSSGRQLYYGSEEIAIAAGQVTSASIQVFATGGADVTVKEGVDQPILTPGAPDMTTQTYPLTITFPSSVATGGTNTIKYVIGSLGSIPSDPTVASAGGTSISVSTAAPLSMHFDDTIKAIVIIGADARTSKAATFSYSRPYFSLAQGSYTGFKEVSLLSMREGATIRYTVSSAAPGADPTYEYGELAGDNTVVTLRHPTSVLKAVSYFAGQPDTVSEVASATYTLDVAASLAVYIDGSAATSGSTTINFGATAPGSAVDETLALANVGNGLDLVLPFAYATLGGTNPGAFTISPASSVEHTVAKGEYSAVTVSFTPGGSTGSLSATLTINSSPTFSINLSGISHNAPTIEFLEALSVSGSTSYSGIYYQAGTLNGYTGYKLANSSTTYVFYSNSYYRVGYNASWTSLLSATSDLYDVNTAYRKNSPYATSPIGFSSSLNAGTDSWGPISGYGTAPWVTWIRGINGKQLSSDNALSSVMTVGRVLEVFYSYSADSGDTESGTTFQWYRKAAGSSSWTAIGGATAKTYTLTSSDIVSGTALKVEVVPRSASGVVGETSVSTITVP